MRGLLYIALFVAVVLFNVWWYSAQWNECRNEMNGTVFYCLKHVL